MGSVYKAKDPRLHREVAIKFIRDNDESLVQRFFREARSQARAVHENICKVYEVGEVEGHPFIVMEYIDGLSLKDVKEQMTREQRITTVKQVAVAMHEAHRLGLIHRDLKPANIMIDRDEAGAFRPHIVDFGLAREIDVQGQHTATGVFEGTLAYMPPEQARGMNRVLDRRADIYALGATLYELLAGRTPFVGSNTVEMLIALLSGDPEPVRHVEPSSHVDLESIVMKCIEKDPGRRYDSARALAEDLQRYLDGDPVLARPTAWWYRAQKKLVSIRLSWPRRATALLATLVLGGVAIRARWSAAEQASLAQELGQDIKGMELFLRYAYALPPHDTAKEKAVVLQRMQQIEARMRQIGSASAGPGHYALGRGNLGLQRYKEAEAHLSLSWNSGYRTPEVAYALGLVLGELYKAALEEAQRIPDDQKRKAYIQESETKYLAPALDRLTYKGGPAVQVESPLYLQALIAFYSKRYEEALAKTQEAFSAAPWLYEAKKLEGDIRSAQGNVGKAARQVRRRDLLLCARDSGVRGRRGDGGERPCPLPGGVPGLARRARGGERAREPRRRSSSPRRSAPATRPSRRTLRACSPTAANPWPTGASANTRSTSARIRARRWTPGSRRRSRRSAETRRTPLPSTRSATSTRPRPAYEFDQGLDPRASVERGAEKCRKATQVRPSFAWAVERPRHAALVEGRL